MLMVHLSYHRVNRATGEPSHEALPGQNSPATRIESHCLPLSDFARFVSPMQNDHFI